VKERQDLLFEADSVGFEVRCSDYCGTVHSVFAKACNLLIRESEGAGAGITTLLHRGTDRSPRGIRLKVAAGFDFQRHFRIGNFLKCRDGVIRFDGCPPITIDMRSADLWDRHLWSHTVDLADPCTARSWIAIRDAAISYAMTKSVGVVPFLQPLIEGAGSGTSRYGRQPGLAVGSRACRPALRRALQMDTTSKILTMRVAENVPAIVAAARDTDSRRAAAGLRSLIGLGPGLTPAGDDFIVGFLAGLWSTRGNRSDRQRFLESLAIEISELLYQTNDISAALLSLAGRGGFSESLVNLVESLSSWRGRLRRGRFGGHDPASAAAQALRTGATSGVVGVAGLLLGQTVWCGRPGPGEDTPGVLGALTEGIDEVSKRSYYKHIP